MIFNPSRYGMEPESCLNEFNMFWVCFDTEDGDIVFIEDVYVFVLCLDCLYCSINGNAENNPLGGEENVSVIAFAL